MDLGLYKGVMTRNEEALLTVLVEIVSNRVFAVDLPQSALINITKGSRSKLSSHAGDCPPRYKTREYFPHDESALCDWRLWREHGFRGQDERAWPLGCFFWRDHLFYQWICCAGSCCSSDYVFALWPQSSIWSLGV